MKKIIMGFLFIISCNSKNCTDKEFSIIYSNCLRALQSHYYNASRDAKYYRLGTIILLEIITKHKANLQQNSFIHFYYENEADFKNDYEIWEKWYETNKCWITMERVDSIYKAYVSDKEKKKVVIGDTDNFKEYYPDDWMDLLTKRKGFNAPENQ